MNANLQFSGIALAVVGALIFASGASAQKPRERAASEATRQEAARSLTQVAQTGYAVNINSPLQNNDVYSNPQQKPLIVIASCNATAATKDLEGWVRLSSPATAADTVASLSGSGRQSITFVVPWNWHYQVKVVIPAGGACNATAWLPY